MDNYSQNNPLISRFYILAALFIGVMYALTIFAPAFVLGRNICWTHPAGDIITNLIGARYFAYDSWRWPLFYVPGLAFPEGANIVYTDSIPLLALAAKILYKITGEWFNYFGLWIFGCFPLLALFVAFATREAGEKNPAAIFGAVMLALDSPALLLRLGHAALLAHFLIAWSLFLYLKFGRTSSIRSSTIQFAVVASLAVVVQAYFLLMVMSFFVAALMKAAADRRMTWRHALFSSAVVFGSIFFTSFVSGIVGPGKVVVSAGGFGHFSMNVLSPFLPSREHLPEFIARYVTWHGYSVDATGGQYEGYNYLGAGMLLLIVVHSVFSRNLVKQAIKRNMFLFLMLSGLFLLALSSRIYFGNWLILDLKVLDNLIKPLTGHFRTSGRFFWPIYYVLAVFLVLTTFKRFSQNAAWIIIAAAVVVQMADTQPIRYKLMQATKGAYNQAVQVLPKHEWAELLKVHQFIEQYPSYQCGGWADNNSNLEVLLLAAELNKPINSAYLARHFRNCENEFIESMNSEIQNEGLYFYSGQVTHHVEDLPDFQKLCRKFKFGLVCTRKWPLLPQSANSLEFTQAGVAPIPEYRLGDLMEFKSNGKASQFLRLGWYESEPWGTWTRGRDSELLLKIAEPLNVPLVMRANATTFFSPNQMEKTIEVYVNGKKIESWKYVPENNVMMHSAIIPGEFLGRDGVIRIKFVSQETESPFHSGLSEDRRQLSLGLLNLSISLPEGRVSK